MSTERVERSYRGISVHLAVHHREGLGGEQVRPERVGGPDWTAGIAAGTASVPSGRLPALVDRAAAHRRERLPPGPRARAGRRRAGGLSVPRVAGARPTPCRMHTPNSSVGRSAGPTG